ncbi:alpha-2-macroglobulin family protein [Hoeflea prorocentri]|uniref:Alpha-2-macroglobulin family protein n=1 Tax=Hoeflea prorocentri TaxID=1922333 RepID=A0A9X3ULM3_9HYPH|nr:alpha-2-macroglobulin family protein [Hoeflea prorocentri]MCY6383507.1 alpha-2-macroglobulin family protein [Hoeflea prorocentri]MDA5401307.1 alpha-2-macroglobulin family protein [Hoeflea prorocentri]
MFKRLGTIAVLIAGIAVAGTALASDTRRIETVDNADYYGFDLRAEKDVTLDECKSICLSDGDCRAFTFNTKAQWCFLKSDFNRLEPFEGAVAGKVVTGTDGADLGAPSDLSFLGRGLYTEASQKKSELTARRDGETGLAATVAAGRNALAAGDPAFAVDAFGRAIGIDPGDVDLWLNLSHAALNTLYAGSQNDYSMQRTASSAALNAYELSRTAPQRAQALDLLAKALEVRQQFRPALEAYKESLALVDSPRVRADFQDLRSRKGFRVVEHTVDADSATARLCVRFSDPLMPTGVDYASYVSIDGRAAGDVTAKGQEICAGGLEHGKTYRLTLRSGLPAEIGEILEAPVTISAYVRDRSPSVRFDGDRFVLPGAGRKGVPVVSINADAVELELYRIGDRSLAPVMAKSRFLRQLDAYDEDTIRDELGEKVWQGTLETGNELNRETITSFPVDEALPERKPGVYVITARVAGERLDNWQSRATQWLVVSDIGLSTFSGSDGLHVFARSLDTAKPRANAELTLLARNNEILGQATTDSDGRAHFAAGLMRGKAGLEPAVVTVTGEDGDFVFLDLSRAGFDLSDRGVSGRAAPGPLDVYAWLDRGIYRAGETVHLSALLRDDAALAVANLPLTFTVVRPDGKEDRRSVRTGGPAGGYQLDLDLPANAMQGAWTIRSVAGNGGAALSETRFLVEDFRPDRIAVDLVLPKAPLAVGGTEQAEIDGRFLYGAPAAGLSADAELKLKSVRTRPSFPGYVFGLADEAAVESQLDIASVPLLNAQGKSTVDLSLRTLPATTHPLEADLTVRLREGGGRAVEKTGTMRVRPEGLMIGIRPGFEGGQVGENATARFQVIAAGADGKAVAGTDLKWSLLQIERDYQWYREGNSWRYEPVEYTKQIRDGVVSSTPETPGEIDVTVDWGRYRLIVETDSPGGPASSIEFDSGWHVSTASTESPDGLEIALDRQSYSAGETARLKITPRFAGEALIAVSNERLHEVFNVTVPGEGTVLDIPVKDGWGAGAYVTATLIMPGDRAESRLPARAVGVKWLAVDPGDRALAVSLQVPDKIQPNTRLDIPITVSGAGKTARITLAAVDVGILNLTAYRAPDPQDWYFGQRRMGVELRDLYGRLIDGSQGVTGRLRTGGDGPGMAIKGSPPREKLVALFSGIVETDADGKATVSFDIPQFNGTLKLMAVAWTDEGVGQAQKDLIVRDPVVVTASLPQFLAPGDVSLLRFDIANTDGPDGAYAVTLDTGEALSVSSPDLPATINLTKGAKTALTVGVQAGQPTQAEVALRLVGPDGTTVENRQSVDVRPATLPVTTRLELPLAANGGSAVVDAELLAANYLDGASVTVGVSKSDFDVPGLLMSLDRYPYGCAEQTTSRALPLLYLSELDAPASLIGETGLRGKIEASIARVLSYQSAAGSFGLWGPGGGDLWLDAYVTDFLTRAREREYAVPQQSMRVALDNLQSVLSYTNSVADDGDGIAYALYVLARNKRASAGDLRYYADAQLDAFRTPMARAQIAAALALYGDVERAQRAFASAYQLADGSAAADLRRTDYGSPLRDDAALLALAGESRPASPLFGDMVRLVSSRQMQSPARTTQEQAWMLLAARAVQDQENTLRLELNGETIDGALSRSVSGASLTSDPLRLRNNGSEALTAIVTTVAAPVQPPEAGGKGFAISRAYYDMSGNEISIDTVDQNTRFVVVLTVQQTTDLPAQIVITDLLPAGVEIDNPRIVQSAALSAFSWLGDTAPAHTEFHSDRFAAAFKTSGSNRDPMRVAYVARAAIPGTYALPAAQVEDMYRPEFAARTGARFMTVRGANQ